MRRALAPLGLRVTVRGQTLLIRATSEGSANNFKLKLLNGIDHHYGLEAAVVGRDASIRIDGRPVSAVGAVAHLRRDDDHLAVEIGGQLGAAGSELLIHVDGGCVLPIIRQTHRDGKTVWLPEDWPTNKRTGRMVRSDGCRVSIGLPKLSTQTLGLPRLTLAALIRSTNAGYMPRRSSEAILAAMRQVLDVQARLEHACKLIDAALIAASADWPTMRADKAQDEGCDPTQQNRRSAA
ncbi:MAG: hypothetical protein AAF561_00935 [Planctomycetota bacterium]